METKANADRNGEQLIDTGMLRNRKSTMAGRNKSTRIEGLPRRG